MMTSRHGMAMPLYLYALSLLPAAASAQDELAHIHEESIEEIVVTASPLPSLLTPADVLDGEELLLRSASSLGEVLANEAGVSSTYFGPVASRPVIRGLTGSRVAVLQDRVASLDVADVSPDHAVPVETILADQVEVLRGPATLIYGNNAAGGIVNIVDSRIPKRRADTPVGGIVEVRGDSASGERGWVARVDGGVADFAWHLDAYRRESDDIEIAGFATADPLERDPDEPRGVLRNSAAETDSYSAGASWLIGERGYLGASWNRYENDYGLPGPEVGEEGEDEEPAVLPGPLLSMEQDRFDVRAEVMAGGLIESIEFAGGFNDYAHQEIEPSGEVGTTFLSEAYDTRLELNHATFAGFDGVVGVQYQWRDFSAIGEEAYLVPNESRSLGAFVYETLPLFASELQIGARLERVRRSADGAPDYRDTSVSLAAGLLVPIADDYSFGVNVTRTERHPNPEELYSNGGHIATRQFEIGLLELGADPELEIAHNIDVSLEQSNSRFGWKLAAFHNAIGDFVFQERNGDVIDGLAVARYAQQDATLRGFEAEFTYHYVLPGGLHIETRLFADMTDAELDNGDPLPLIPPRRVGAALEWVDERWRFGFDLIAHAAQDNVSSFETDGFTMLNAHGMYEIGGEHPGRMQVFFRATNLLDEDARRASSVLAGYAPLPGASLLAGARLRF
jgi:iron complex outermembrane receptor protein